jgi:hypothetical protein
LDNGHLEEPSSERKPAADHEALDPQWNAMTHFTQWQVRPGATLLEGVASPHGFGLPGGTKACSQSWRSLIPMTSKNNDVLKDIRAALSGLALELAKPPVARVANESTLVAFIITLERMLKDIETGNVRPRFSRTSGMGWVIVDN